MMAKRLSKALRGKRRWLGIECSGQFTSRSALEKHILMVLQSCELPEDFRLMDFHPSGSEAAVLASEKLDLTAERGFAILEIPHPSYQEVRQCFGADDAFTQHGVLSRTSSGKIRLVRERLMLPRPNRKS